MAFDALDRSLDLVRSLAPLATRIASHDPKLADQLRRAASSTALNVAEASARAGRDRRNRFRIALGSVVEVRAALAVAVAWGYLADVELTAALVLADRVAAMTWRLAR